MNTGRQLTENTKCEKCKFEASSNAFKLIDSTNEAIIYECPKCNTIFSSNWEKLVKEKEKSLQSNKYVYSSSSDIDKAEEMNALAIRLHEATDFPEFARRAVKDIGIYYDKNKYWWIWKNNECRWAEVDETDILNTIDSKILQPSNTINKLIKYSLCEALRREGRLQEPKALDWHWVQFKDTLYNFQTGQKMPASREYFVANPIPWVPGTSTETPELDKLLSEWLNTEGEDARDIKILKDILAWSVVPWYFIQTVPFIYGPGADGKSQFVRLLGKFVGKNNIATSTIEYIEGSNFGTYNLHKKLVCIIPEVPKNEIRKFTTIKAISGRGEVHLEKKGVSRSDAMIYSKIILIGNDIPVCEDTSDGFFRRIHPIPFKNQFKEAGDVFERVPDQEYSNLAAWCMQRLPQLEKEYLLTGDTTDIQSKREKYKNLANNVNAFLKSSIIDKTKKYTDIMQVSELFNMFNEWAEQNSKPLMDYKEFKAKLVNAGIQCELGYIRDANNNNQHRLLAYGVKKRPQPEPEQKTL